MEQPSIQGLNQRLFCDAWRSFPEGLPEPKVYFRFLEQVEDDANRDGDGNHNERAFRSHHFEGE